MIVIYNDNKLKKHVTRHGYCEQMFVSSNICLTVLNMIEIFPAGH